MALYIVKEVERSSSLTEVTKDELQEYRQWREEVQRVLSSIPQQEIQTLENWETV